MKNKKLTAKRLLDYLTELDKNGHNLSKITINYRHDGDSDVDTCSIVEEDLYDEETNGVLQSIIIQTKR